MERHTVQSTLIPLALLALTGIANCQLASLVDNSGTQHVFYIAMSNGHVNQLYYSGGSSWVNRDLTSLGGGHTASTSDYSPMTSYLDHSGDEHVVYLDTNGHINQLVFNGSSWSNQDLTASFGGHAVQSAVAISSYVDASGGQHICYSDTSAHVNQLVYTGGSSWTNQDLTASYGGAHRVETYTTLSSFVDTAGGQHIGYVDNSSHINQLFYGSGWSNQDLTASYGGSPYEFTALTGYASSSGGQHFVYVATNDDVNQLVYNGSSWSNQDLTVSAHASAARTAPLTSYVDHSSGQHVGYLNSSIQVNQLVYTGGSSWSNQNLTLSGGGSPTYLTVLSSFVDQSGGQHIAYVDNSNHVNQLFYTGGSSWSNQDLTVSGSGLPAVP